MKTEEYLRELKQGKVIIYPTETAYGIAADIEDKKAVEKVYELKDRDRSKGITAICSSVSQAERYSNMTPSERKTAKRLMPAPLTLVVEGNGKAAANLNDKFAFRVSEKTLCRKLSRHFPITATSANVSGNPTSYSVEDISEDVKSNVSKIIDEGRLEKSPVSTVAEIENGTAVIHREGPVSKQDIEDVIQL